MIANENERIENKYEKAFSQLGEIQTIFPASAKLEIAQMVERFTLTDDILKDKILNTKWSVPQKAGRAAEELLAETHDLEAILRGKESRTITDRHPQWEKIGLIKDDPVSDIVGIDGDGNVIYKAQAKFYKSASDTAKEIRKVEDGSHKYADVDALICPEEQLNDIIDISRKTARIETVKGRKPVAEASENTAEKAIDKCDFDNAPGKSFEQSELNEIAKSSEKGEKIKKTYRNDYQKRSTIKQMKQAATGAAAISAIMSGTFNTVVYCKMVRDGKMSESEAVIKIIGETASSAADSALKASANVGLQSLMVRYGTREMTKQIAKNSLKSLVRTNMVTVGVVCGIDMIKDLVRLSAGKIDKQEFEAKNGKNVLNTSAGVMGAGVVSNVAALIPIPYAGLIGGIAGGLIAGLAMQFAIENHIEKPYQELVSNTVALTQSMQIFQRVLESVFKGQIVFGAFLEEEKKLDLKFENQLKIISVSGDNMKNAINRL